MSQIYEGIPTVVLQCCGYRLQRAAESLHASKCGNFAVLVDLHVLPLGGQEDASWFTTDHIE
ncbi:hypothetical protein INR49_009910, partial [Caranx melampygus]